MADKEQARLEKKPKFTAKLKHDNENDARLGIIEDLFNDFYLRRHRVYWVNFVRGIFFGFGSVLGGTLLVGLAVWILSQFVHWPGVGDFFVQLTDTLQHASR